ncbi:hypothetical protein GS415_06780 [Rhodococcus hoagii]|nr:hypothetical protein [Prescottella equi]
MHDRLWLRGWVPSMLSAMRLMTPAVMLVMAPMASTSASEVRGGTFFAAACRALNSSYSVTLPVSIAPSCFSAHAGWSPHGVWPAVPQRASRTRDSVSAGW